MIKAIIFDMDGVLIDAKEWHYESLNRALLLFGLEIDRESHLRTYDGLPTNKKLEILSREFGLPRELHPLINDMKQTYTLEMVHTLCKPLDAHHLALSKLKELGYGLAVASNSVRDSVHKMMAKAELVDYLDLMLSNEDVTQPKPAPDIYAKAISHFGFLPEECLVLEDNEYGIQAAQDAGAHVLIIKDVAEVNIDNILRAIHRIEGKTP